MFVLLPMHSIQSIHIHRGLITTSYVQHKYIDVTSRCKCTVSLYHLYLDFSWSAHSTIDNDSRQVSFCTRLIRVDTYTLFVHSCLLIYYLKLGPRHVTGRAGIMWLAGVVCRPMKFHPREALSPTNRNFLSQIQSPSIWRKTSCKKRDLEAVRKELNDELDRR